MLNLNMRRQMIVFFAWILIPQFGYNQFVDHFSDGDFTNNPVWTGDTHLFAVTANKLNSQSLTSGTYYLSTPSNLALNAQWDFYFNMQFGTSGVNYIDVYLLSDVADLTTPNAGYFVRIGGSSDKISLYKIVGGTETILIDGPNGVINSSSNNPFDVRVTRDAEDNWTLFYDDGAASTLVSIGTLMDNSIAIGGYFGIVIKQSGAASVVNGHFFDNFVLASLGGADVSPPTIDSVLVLNTNNLSLYFNEPVRLSSSQNQMNYAVDHGIGSPNFAVRDVVDPTIVHLTFATAFTNGHHYNLTTNSVADTLGNALGSSVESFAYLRIITPNFEEVILNEIFADPSPTLGLPTKEFVELYNTTSNLFVLNNWKFVNSTAVKTLPNFYLQPNSYVILCDRNDTALYTPYGDVIGLSSFTALINGGDSLTLLDNNNNVLDIVNYEISWYQDAIKAAGGWTLERVNPSHPCTNAANWSASENPTGGTPGVQNSIFEMTPDTQSPQIDTVHVISLTHLAIFFTEIMDSTSLAHASYTISGLSSVSGITVQSSRTEVLLSLAPAIDSLTFYTLTISGATDCSGNNLTPDSILFSKGLVDVIPPQFDSLMAIDEHNLAIYFNEPVHLSSSQNQMNYAVDHGIGSPNFAVRDVVDPTIVHLTFATAFTNGQHYNLTTNSVADTLGNALGNSVDPFAYLRIIAPNFEEVILNEIFADPSPAVDLPAKEFVELYNNTNNLFVLNNWKFVNSTAVKTLPNFYLQPNSYVILCDLNDTALYTPYGDVIGLSSFTALTNGGDSLTLLDNNNNVLDMVNYEISWYQDAFKATGGWTLERVNPSHPCTNAANWSASENLTGGTPGVQNSVFDNSPDVQGPVLISATPFSNNQLTILMSEPMDSASLMNAVFGISNGVTISNVFVANDYQRVDLTTTTPLDASIVYALTITGAIDCAGNGLIQNTINFGIGAIPSSYEVVINELFADPLPSNGLPTEDYLELYNRTTKILDLSNCWISDLTSRAQISAGKILPGEYVILCDKSFENDFMPFGKVIAVHHFPSLNNTEDQITLYTEDSLVIHSVHYTNSWYRDDTKKEGGWSLEMIDPNNPCQESENWMASTNWIGGTPGTENTAFGNNTDLDLPTLTKASATSDSTLLVSFNENLDREGMLVAIYTIDQGLSVSAIQLIDTKNVHLHFSSKMGVQVKYTLTVTGAYDCLGNTIGNDNTATFALPEQGSLGDVVINEVLFNPFTGSDDFVEIYNNSTKFINLQNWSLANLESDSIANYKTLTDQPKLIFPGEFVVLTKNAEGVETDYFKAVRTAFLQLESLPTYSNDEGEVYLINNLNRVVDAFHYQEDLHFELLKSKKGVSLERIDYDRPSSDPTNWHSAAEAVGFATPGFENSQYFKANNGGGEIVVSPETFSPDNDGWDDVVTISYHFSSEGFVANVLIYDAKGRLVKRLIQNELLGRLGAFSWDGINDANEIVPIGIYIIFVHVFDVDGKVKSVKKTVVLAGRFN
jgi:hypothetical protein